MSDQYPVSPPPPAHEPSAMPPAYPGMAAPPPKKKTGLIIALVVGALLLCCCVTAGAATLFLLPSGSTTTSSTGDLASLPESSDDPRIAEWLDWEPAGPPLLDALPTSMDALMAEGVEMLAPDFSAEEAVWRAGYYEPSEDWYYADAVFVRASHPSSDQISAVIEMWIQSDQMLAEDVAFEPQEDEIVATIDGGSRELVYWSQWGDGFELDTSEETALWAQLGEDWPGAVVVSRSSEGDQYVVELTKWSLYAVDDDYPYVAATYEEVDGGWELVEWQYFEVDDETTSAS